MYVDHGKPYVWMMVANINAPVARNGSLGRAFLLSIAAADHLGFTPDRGLSGRFCFQKKDRR
jgi:hypothetical protein